MHSYIAIQNTYDIFEMALFINNQRVDYAYEDKRHTSKLFIPLLDQLLVRNSIHISNLSFCAVNCGPGPFSTLRSIIASVNGLHAATNIPLMSIDGLEALFLESYDKNYSNTIILLNAFNNEVYYLIAHQDKIIAKGYKPITTFLVDIKQRLSNQPINFIGNGVTLHYNLITNELGDNAIIQENSPQFCSLEIIGRLGLDMFMHNKKTTDYLMPLHLKKHAVEL
ncbi:MAG TPA: tRNA (adenosine(37)-N6)-threonylcarbamoyltransferase complex dimerization subunit type 1 TsaB [Candidatus Babeliales bacterium]|nr:tRNA (adenosine(37)-N6)-threonylcarbamoyltransferase complex dimerization subunit type 1 TsaB [Candidatus Babeliales bacterium]